MLLGSMARNRSVSEPCLKNLCGETGIWAEQQRGLAADDAPVEMGHGHRRRTQGSLPIDLGVVALYDLLSVASEPDAAHREAAVSISLGNIGFLQQFQRAAARADENELRGDFTDSVGRYVLNLDKPSSAVRPLEVPNAMPITQIDAGLLGEVIEKQVGQRAIVNVRAGDDAGGCHRLIRGAALHDERRPGADLCMALGIFHAAIAVVRRHSLEASLEERDVGVAPDEAHVWTGMDEVPRIGDGALPDEIGPELTRDVELCVDFQRP